MIENRRNQRLAALDCFFDGDAFFHVENDLRPSLLHRNNAQDAGEHSDRKDPLFRKRVDVRPLFFCQKESHAFVFGL